MNAACVPVFESGDGCPRKILVTSSSGRPHPTRWREWLGSRTPKGDAFWRVITRSNAVSANRYSSARIESGHASKVGNRFLTPFPELPQKSSFNAKRLFLFSRKSRYRSDSTCPSPNVTLPRRLCRQAGCFCGFHKDHPAALSGGNVTISVR